MTYPIILRLPKESLCSAALKNYGKPGRGASVEFKIKEGPITMLGITQTYDGRFKFVIGEGISERGPILPTGNTNTRGRFAPSTKEFVKKMGDGRTDASLCTRHRSSRR